MNILMVVGLMLGIRPAQAFYFLSKEDSDTSQQMALETRFQPVQQVATWYPKINDYVYATGTAISPTVVLTTRHFFEDTDLSKSFFFDQTTNSWIQMSQVVLSQTVPSGDHEYKDDLAVCQLITSIELKTFPQITLSNTKTISGVCCGYGRNSWVQNNVTPDRAKVAVPVRADQDPHGYYRQKFQTSPTEGQTSIQGFSFSDPTVPHRPAFGMPGDSGAPLLNQNGEVCAIYTHNSWYKAREKGAFQPNKIFYDNWWPVSWGNPWLSKTLQQFGMSPPLKPA